MVPFLCGGYLADINIFDILYWRGVFACQQENRGISAEIPRNGKFFRRSAQIPRKFRGMENFLRGTIFGTENFLKIDAEENAEWKMNFIPFADLCLD